MGRMDLKQIYKIVNIEVKDPPSFGGINHKLVPAKAGILNSEGFPMSKSKIRHLFDGIRPSLDGTQIRRLMAEPMNIYRSSG